MGYHTHSGIDIFHLVLMMTQVGLLIIMSWVALDLKKTAELKSG